MYKRKTSGWSQHVDFMILDTCCLEIALVLSFFLSENWRPFVWNRFHILLSSVMAVVNIMILLLSDAYHSVIRRSTSRELLSTLKQTLYVAISLTILLLILQDDITLSRRVFFVTVPLYCLLCFSMRVLWKEHLQKRLNLKHRTGLLIVTTEEKLSRTLKQITSFNFGVYHLTGIVLMDHTKPYSEYDEQLRAATGNKAEYEDLRVVADAETIVPWLTTHWGDEVYLDVSGAQIKYQELVNEILAMGLTVHMAMVGLENIEARNKNVEWICGELTITASLGYVTRRSMLLKRIMDILGGLIGCLITILLAVFVGPAIYLASPGPIFFKQTRIGYNGVPFQIYKFRSMYLDADERKKQLQQDQGREDELMFKMERDPRIIGAKELPDGRWKKGIGGWIRDFSIDEFPQFFNVLKGEMSLVGTRPPTVEEWERYEAWHKSRMATKPGITGLWQVSGRSQIRDFDQVVQLDREYIEEWNLLLDIKILLKTIVVVLQRKGAM